MSEDFYSKDLRQLKNACERFLAEKVGRKRFVQDVKRTLRGYDALTLSFTLSRVESTVHDHFCEFWDECHRGECVKEKSPAFWRREMASWSPLTKD